MTETMIIENTAGKERHTRRVVVRPPFPGGLEPIADPAPDPSAEVKPLQRLHLLDRRLFY
jgi:hypothetical protein